MKTILTLLALCACASLSTSAEGLLKPAPVGATHIIELGVFTAAESVIRLQLMAKVNGGPLQALRGPIVFKTARDRIPGFLLRLHAYDAGGESPSRVLVDVVDGKSGVIYHRFEHGFGIGARFQIVKARPVPDKNPPVMLISPTASSAMEVLIGAEKIVPPGAAASESWLLIAKMDIQASTSSDATLLFQLPPSSAPQPPAPKPGAAVK